MLTDARADEVKYFLRTPELPYYFPLVSLIFAALELSS